MALPKLDTPRYKMKLPSTGKVVNFRPFLVKEEKKLLIATETGEQEDIIRAISDIIEDCTDLQDIKTLPTFDIEYVFLQIRTKSVGETVEVNIICPDDGVTEVKAEIPLDEIAVKKTRGHKQEIKLSDEIILTMGYPTLKSFVELNFGDGEAPGVEQMFNMAANCVQTIADPNQVYDCKDTPQNELLEFFDGMSSSQFKQIQEFFETMPKLEHTLKVMNPKTNVESEVKLEGLSSFSPSKLMHTSLMNYYQTNFALIHHHKWQIDHIENLMPWEKDIYISMLVDFLKEEEKRMKERQRS